MIADLDSYADLSPALPPATTLNKFYVTFGIKYATERHPTFEDAHPDGVLEVSAVDTEAARAIVTDKLGSAWAFLYPAGEFHFDHYPLGVLAIL